MPMASCPVALTTTIWTVLLIQLYLDIEPANGQCTRLVTLRRLIRTPYTAAVAHTKFKYVRCPWRVSCPISYTAYKLGVLYRETTLYYQGYVCCSGYSNQNNTCLPVCNPDCLNNGTCVGPDVCECTKEWSGSSCDIPRCDQPCLNGGNCTAVDTCSCPSGFHGDHCQSPVCDPPCLNSGECIQPDACSCSAGYAGDHCQDLCPENTYGLDCQTCQCYNGTCDPYNANHTCLCAPGWQGSLCDSFCDENTWGQDCLNTCSCINGESCDPVSGECFCSAGYTGNRCQHVCPENTYGLGCQACSCYNGTCDTHKIKHTCLCAPGWQGDLCEWPCDAGTWGQDCQNGCQCVNSMSCDPVSGACYCLAGYTGKTCSLFCPSGTYGDGCGSTCDCQNGGLCDPFDGNCTCLAGWQNANCSEPCDQGQYGLHCDQLCSCENGAVDCDPVTGDCVCTVGYRGRNCTELCLPGRYGLGCSKLCSCKNGAGCAHTDGVCTCADGWHSDDCSLPCPHGRYGMNCSRLCECENGALCDHMTGQCSCTAGWRGVVCKESCPTGTFGAGCAQRCECTGHTAFCDAVTGHCHCHPGWQGAICNASCPDGKFGNSCSELCLCQNGAVCDPVTGFCNCSTTSGWHGPYCNQSCPQGTYGSECTELCTCENNATCLPQDGSCVCSSIWTGTYCDVNSTAHALTSEIYCYLGNGENYTGKVNRTESSFMCRRWDRKLSVLVLASSDSNLEDNHCRNPNGTREAPWCYTTSPFVLYGYCGIPECGRSLEERQVRGVCETVAQFGGECGEFFGKDTNVFIATGSSQTGLDTAIRFAKSEMEKNFFRPPCTALLKHVLCQIVMPRCSRPSSQNTPLRLCREDCELVRTQQCPAEWNHSVVLSKRFPEVGISISQICSGLPSMHSKDKPYQCNSFLKTAVLYKGHCSSYSGQYSLYNGQHNLTTSGQTCLPWSTFPKFSPSAVRQYSFDLVGAENYCRDPYPYRGRLWCVVGPHAEDWEYCNVTPCSTDDAVSSTAVPLVTGSSGPQTTSSKNMTSLVIGISCGFLLLLVIIIVTVLFLTKNKKKKSVRIFPTASGQWIEMPDGGPFDEKTFLKFSSPRTSLATLGVPGAELQSVSAWPKHVQSRKLSTSTLAEISSVQSLTPHGSASFLMPPTAGFGRGVRKSRSRSGSFVGELDENPRLVAVQAALCSSGCVVGREAIQLEDSIGEGAFGRVFRGLLTKGGKDQAVAAKSVKDSFDNSVVLAFLTEANFMLKFSHPNVIWVEGICLETVDPTDEPDLAIATIESPNITLSRSSSTGEDDELSLAWTRAEVGRSPLILLPFMENGDLHSLLKKARRAKLSPKWLTSDRLLSMAIDISQGLAYLSSQGCIHRDLAARNCLVNSDYKVLISDFGMSRDVLYDDYYRQEQGGRVPVKWMAPECLHDRLFTKKSDVWSYAVTVWEIYSLGKVPYPGISNYAIPNYLADGRRLDKPEKCPEKVFSLLLQCWKDDANQRPSIHSIVDELQILQVDLRNRNNMPQPSLPPPEDDYIDMLPPQNSHGILV